MSRRLLAPILLLLVSIASVGAVLGIHQIESGSGPLAEPSASAGFSPDGNGAGDTATLSFNAQSREHVTVQVLNADDRTIATLLNDEPVRGATFVEWDGTDDDGAQQPEGAYRFHITRRGDHRTYAPSAPTMLDLTPPRGRLDELRHDDGLLFGRVIAEPGVRLAVAVSTDERLPTRSWTPRAGTAAARSTRPLMAGEGPTRFRVDLTRDELQRGVTIYLLDAALNETLLARVDDGDLTSDEARTS